MNLPIALRQLLPLCLAICAIGCSREVSALPEDAVSVEAPRRRQLPAD